MKPQAQTGVSIAQLYNAAGDVEDMKTALRGLLAKTKDQAMNKTPGGRGRKRARFANKTQNAARVEKCCKTTHTHNGDDYSDVHVDQAIHDRFN